MLFAAHIQVLFMKVVLLSFLMKMFLLDVSWNVFLFNLLYLYFADILVTYLVATTLSALSCEYLSDEANKLITSD